MTAIGPASRFARGSEVIEPVIDRAPESVECRPGLVGVIAADIAVLVDEMLMPRRFRKSIAAEIFEHRTEVDVQSPRPPVGRLVDGVIGIAQLDGIDPEGNPLHLVE